MIANLCLLGVVILCELVLGMRATSFAYTCMWVFFALGYVGLAWAMWDSP